MDAFRRRSQSRRVFRSLLKLPDGDPPDPAVLMTAVPTWSVGDVITVGRGEQLRVVAIDAFPHAELVEHDVSRDLHRRAGVRNRGVAGFGNFRGSTARASPASLGTPDPHR
jgi:hypothetical protein